MMSWHGDLVLYSHALCLCCLLYLAFSSPVMLSETYTLFDSMYRLQPQGKLNQSMLCPFSSKATSICLSSCTLCASLKLLSVETKSPQQNILIKSLLKYLVACLFSRWRKQPENKCLYFTRINNVHASVYGLWSHSSCVQGFYNVK